MSQAAYFDLASGSVRFWVEVDSIRVGASVGKEVLHYRFHPNRIDDDPLQTFAANAQCLDAAVRRRVAAGAREPIMVRTFDLDEQPAAAGGE